MSGFPTDPVTLAALRSACEPSADDDGHSHLFDFLDFGPTKWAPQEVISALVDEVEALRAELGARP